MAFLFLLTGCRNKSEQLPGQAQVAPADHLEHLIQASHPSLLDEGPVELTLVQWLDSDGWPKGFSIEIESVICRDVKCEIIPVQMFFDVLGNYQKIELRFGDELTKMDHIPFSDEDYDKLQQILSNRTSALRNIKADQVVTPEQAMEKKAVDGISGATALTEEESIVEGAAYTSYTLWHWANNPDIQAQAHTLTAKLAVEDQLLGFLDMGNEQYLHFAVDQLIAKKLFGEVARSAVTTQLGPDKDRTVKPVMRYLEAATTSTGQPHYFQFIEENFHSLEDQTRVRMLESMQATSLQAPDGFMDSISRWLPKLKTYYEVHLLLELLDSKNPGSPVTTEQATRLLEHENFLIARRSFWFLEEQELTPSQAEKVNSFHKKHVNRL